MCKKLEIPLPVLRFLSHVLLKVGFALEIKGIENLKGLKGPVLLAGNHTGLLDSLIVLASFPKPFLFIMDESVFGWDFIGKLVPYCNILSIRQSHPKEALLKALSQLKRGISICIFPEGRLTRDGLLNPFNPGAAFLQQKGNVPIVPFAIQGGYSAWPHGQRWPKFGKIKIIFAEPIQPDINASREEIMLLLVNKIRQVMSQTLSESGI